MLERADSPAIRPKKECIKSCETCFVYTLNLNDKGPSMKWVCFPKFHSPLANWPWLRISPQSSLCVIYCLILTAWQWLMSFTCIPVQTEPHKSPLRKRFLVLLLWEIGHLSSPSRSCLGRLILIRGGRGFLWQSSQPHTSCRGQGKPQGTPKLGWLQLSKACLNLGKTFLQMKVIGGLWQRLQWNVRNKIQGEEKYIENQSLENM